MQLSLSEREKHRVEPLSEMNLQQIAKSLSHVSVLTNFASPLQFGGLVLGKPSEARADLYRFDSMHVFVQESSMSVFDKALPIIRIFFAGQLGNSQLRNLLDSFLAQGKIVVCNFLSPQELLQHTSLLTELGLPYISPYPELQCDVELLVTALHDNESGDQSKFLADAAKQALRRTPELRYERLDESAYMYCSRIDIFLQAWQEQSGLSPTLPKRLIDRFQEDPDLYGGVICDPSMDNAVVALNVFCQHPSFPDIVISTVDQNLRLLGHRKYSKLGILSHLWQAQHISQKFPMARRILIGGVGTTDNQRWFKRQVAMPGELWSYAVVFDPQNLMEEMSYQQKAGIAHKVWE